MTIRIAPTDSPVLSVILVVYRAAKSVIETVDSLARNTTVPFELILVDNASPDASGAAVRAHVSGATFIWNKSNLGFGPAINVAAAHAKADVLCLLNPDVLLASGWELPLLETLRTLDCGAVSPVIVNADGSIEAGRTIDKFGFTHPFVSDVADDSKPFPVQYASAVCLCVVAEKFAAIGGFDERFVPAYFEDVDLCLSLTCAGYPVLVNPRSSVHHIGGVSSTGGQRQEMFGANLRRFTEKWDLEQRRTH